MSVKYCQRLKIKLQLLIVQSDSSPSRAKHVYGYEVVPQAITDAHKNAQINGIENATFIQGDLNKIGEDFGNNFPKPDIVISGYNHLLHIVKFHLGSNTLQSTNRKKCFYRSQSTWYAHEVDQVSAKA